MIREFIIITLLVLIYFQQMRIKDLKYWIGHWEKASKTADGIINEYIKRVTPKLKRKG